ncbi:MAG: chloramphenicol acetyltransferase [Spirochaetes bacterium]|nr:chloramphenicol acetyltransferase [Spirochaetota bacterium]
MKEIDINSWKRKEHFNFFRNMDYPHFNISFEIDITGFADVLKKNNLPFYYTMIYFSTAAANETEEFKYRIRDNRVILHDVLHPSFTDMRKDDDLFKFITAEMKSSLTDFLNETAGKAASQKEFFRLHDLQGRDDFIFYTSIPWISFTQLSHTISFNKNDSVPRLSWGKYFNQDNRIILPYSVQVNHCFADGIHIAKFKDKLESMLNNYKF